jgi:hypothetical protein
MAQMAQQVQAVAKAAAAAANSNSNAEQGDQIGGQQEPFQLPQITSGGHGMPLYEADQMVALLSKQDPDFARQSEARKREAVTNYLQSNQREANMIAMQLEQGVAAAAAAAQQQVQQQQQQQQQQTDAQQLMMQYQQRQRQQVGFVGKF